MRIVLLNTDYRSFLNKLHRDAPQLERADYAAQIEFRNRTLFSSANFYSRAFEKQGHFAADIYVNNAFMQNAWAQEHGLTERIAVKNGRNSIDSVSIARLKRALRPYRRILSPTAHRFGLVPSLDDAAHAILAAQIEALKPDLIMNMDIFAIGPELIRRIRRRNNLVFVYCGVDPPANADLSVYDVGLSMLDWVVQAFGARGLPSYQWHLAFEPSILSALGSAQPPDIPVSFIGSLLADHGNRIRLLESIARSFPLQIWAPTLAGISSASPLHGCYQGEVYGREFYELLQRSKISLNAHVDAARGQAANARQFEATGVGSLLLTDNRQGLEMLFSNNEVANYTSPDDALEKISFYLQNDDQRREMALAGQRRTLAEHNYVHRVGQMLDIVGRHLK